MENTEQTIEALREIKEHCESVSQFALIREIRNQNAIAAHALTAAKFARSLNANVCLNHGEAGKCYSPKRIKFKENLNVFLSADELI